MADETFEAGVPGGNGWSSNSASGYSTVSVENGMLKLERTTSSGAAQSPVLMYALPKEITKGRIAVSGKMKSVGVNSGGVGFFMWDRVSTIQEDDLINLWYGGALKGTGFDVFAANVAGKTFDFEDTGFCLHSDKFV